MDLEFFFQARYDFDGAEDVEEGEIGEEDDVEKGGGFGGAFGIRRLGLSGRHKERGVGG